jgi:hypothetical protein
MKCPHCDSGVSLFSPSVNRSRWGNKCPHCGALVRWNFKHKKALLVCLGGALVPLIVAPALSPAYGHLLLSVCSFAVAGVGLVALTQIELVPRSGR